MPQFGPVGGLHGHPKLVPKHPSPRPRIGPLGHSGSTRNSVVNIGGSRRCIRDTTAKLRARDRAGQKPWLWLANAVHLVNQPALKPRSSASASTDKTERRHPRSRVLGSGASSSAMRTASLVHCVRTLRHALNTALVQLRKAYSVHKQGHLTRGTPDSRTPWLSPRTTQS